MASLEDLASSLANFRDREKALKAEIKAASAATRMPDHPSAKPCTPRMQSVALRILALAGFSVEAPLKYLSMNRRAVSEAELRAWHGALSAECQDGLLSPPPHDKLAVRYLAEANKFMKEFRLIGWVRDQNTSKGVAPTSSLIVEQADPDLVQSRNRKNQSRWVRKCMRRWGGRRARFSHGDQLSQEEFRMKARFAFQLTFGLVSGAVLQLFCGPNFGAIFWPQFGARLVET